jgi:hypothetical protein
MRGRAGTALARPMKSALASGVDLGTVSPNAPDGARRWNQQFGWWMRCSCGKRKSETRMQRRQRYAEIACAGTCPGHIRSRPHDRRGRTLTRGNSRARAKQCLASPPRIRTTFPGSTLVLKPWGPGAVRCGQVRGGHRAGCRSDLRGPRSASASRDRMRAGEQAFRPVQRSMPRAWDSIPVQRDNYDGRLPTIKLAKSGSRRVASRELPV